MDGSIWTKLSKNALTKRCEIRFYLIQKFEVIMSLLVKEITVNLDQNCSVIRKITNICMKVDNKILTQKAR